MQDTVLGSLSSLYRHFKLDHARIRVDYHLLSKRSV